MRKAISILLALCMVLTMMAPAFAADDLVVAADLSGVQAEPAAQEPAAPAAERPVVYEYETVTRDKITGIVAGSQETNGEDTPAERAFDGNLSTIWHTKWDQSGEKTIQWSLTEPTLVGRIVYYSRPANSRNGAWQNVTMQGKNGDGEWVDLVKNVDMSENEMRREFDFAPVTLTTIKVTVNQGFGGFASAAELQTVMAIPQQANGVTKQGLRDLRAAAAAMPLDSYTQESRDVLTAALAEADAIINRNDATPVEVGNATAKLEAAVQGLQVLPEMLAPEKPANGTTQGQPFLAGQSGNSANFRIPSIITLKNQQDTSKNGRLVAAIDARWNHTGDACALDTILSVSDDNGANWNYSFPNYFNDSTDQMHSNATAFIDPVMVEAEDGTIYMMVDLYPGGVAINTAPRSPATDTGYRTIDGVKRLVLYNGVGGAQNANNYTYYVGDFVDGYAPVIEKDDTTKTARFYVDAHYYLYSNAKAALYCQQLGSDKFVKQNVFFENAKLHVRDATYLWLIKSTDGGDTWGDPVILNPQIRPDTNTQKFYGVGPGAGLSFVAADGTNVILLEAYTFSNQKTSFIYTTNGKDWKRAPDATEGNHWSSESALVQINDTTVRQFYRDGYSALNYTDYTWDAERQEFIRLTLPAAVPGASKTTNNQLSAIRYSSNVNGKPLFLLSTANGGGGSRTHGHIYALSLNADGTMEVLHTYRVPNTEAKYGYSSLTETKDGSIALLYEGPLRSPNNGSIYEDMHFVVIPVADLLPDGVEIGNDRHVEVPLYGTVEADLVLTEAQLAELNAIGTVKAESKNGKTVLTGLQAGQAGVQLNADARLELDIVPVYPEQNVALKKGEAVDIPVDGPVTFISGTDVVKATLTDIKAVRAQGKTGTDANFSAGTEPLSASLYTFTDQKDGTYTVQGTTADGQKVYLAMRHAVTGNTGFPFHPDRKTVIIQEHGAGKFSLHDRSNRDGYLYFWKSGDKAYTYDINDRYAADNCDFELYKLADGTNGTLAGFEKLNSLADIVSGEQYLIVSVAGNDRYALHPSTNRSNKFTHVIKAGAAAEEVAGQTMKLEGQQVGEAVVVAGGTAYKVWVDYAADEYEWKGAQVSLSGSVGVRFFADFSKELMETGTIAIDVMNTRVAELPISSLKPTSNGFVIEVSVAVRQMTDPITIQVMQDGAPVGEPLHYTVRKYADTVLNDVSGRYDAATKNFVRTMLYHGAQMQIFKGYYDKERLATDGLEGLAQLEADAAKVTAESLKPYQPTLSGKAPAGLTLYGTNLSLEDETTLRFFFRQADPAAEFTFTVNGNPAAAEKADDLVYVEFPDIPASGLHNMWQVTAADGTDTLTVQYSALSYARSVLMNKAADAKLANVARSLVLYNRAGVAYVESQVD